jgi:hypothetical protein
MTPRIPLLALSLALLAACSGADANDARPNAATSSASAQTDGAGAPERRIVTTVQTRLPTSYGELTVTRTGEEGIRGGLFVVAVDSNEVFRDSMGMTVEPYAFTAALEMGPVVVIGITSGGTACPMMFRVVHLPEDGSPIATDEFGDCSDIPDVHVDGRRVVMRFPGFYPSGADDEPGFEEPGPTAFAYEGGGRLRPVPPPPPVRDES